MRAAEEKEGRILVGNSESNIEHEVCKPSTTPWFVWTVLAAIALATIGSELFWHSGLMPGHGPGSLLHHGLSVAVAILLCAAVYGSARYLARKRAHFNASFSAEHFRTLANAAGDVAFYYDIRKRVMTWTADLGAQLLGYAQGELQVSSDRFDELVHGADRDIFKWGWQELLEKRAASFEVRLRNKADDWSWVQIHAVPMGGNSHVSKVVGVIRQTQKLHEAEEALMEAERLQTVGTMAGGIAHEFNNHLTPIRGYLELALDDLGGEHVVSEGLKTALDRVEYCAELVSQIQAYGRKTLLRPKPESVSRLLPTMLRLAMSRNLEQAERIVLEEVIPEDLPEIWVDQAQLQDAVVHLVDNACDAMPGGGSLTVRAEEVYIHKRNAAQGVVHNGTYLCLSFSDTGEGIAPENQAHIFDPFFTTRGRARARGMGLSMVQGMVAQHDGYIEVQSQPDQGTHVRMFLPLGMDRTLRGDVVLLDEPQDDTARVLPAAPVGMMIVADDEPSIRGIVSRVFGKEGWHIVEAANGAELGKKLDDEHTTTDLVILDILMPGPSAEDTIRRIHERKLGTKVLLISGFSMDERIEQLTRSGDVSYISKPFSPKDLLMKVDEVMTAA